MRSKRVTVGLLILLMLLIGIGVYDKIYNKHEKTHQYQGCLHPNDEAEVKKFVQKIAKLPKTEFSKFYSKDINKEFYKGEHDEMLQSELFDNYQKYYSISNDKTDTYRTSFIKSQNKEGCYMYEYFHAYKPPAIEAHHYTSIIIKKSNEGLRFSWIRGSH